MNIINEVSRKNLVGKTKVQSPERYDKRLRYSTMSIPEIEEERLLKFDQLVIEVKVGNYTDHLAYEGVMKRLIDIVKRDPKHAVTRRAVVRAMNEQVDLTDVYVRCSCPDFRYRFAAWATKHDYLWGPPESRPAKIRNPKDNMGATCKHIASILSNKKWLVKASSVVNDYIHEHYEEVVEQYHINKEEFLIDEHQYHAASMKAAKQAVKRLPPDLLGATNRLYDAKDLEIQLFEILDHRGWWIAVDTDLDTPNYVRVSKDAKALEDENALGEVFTFEVVPAGTKVKLKRVESITENY